MDLMDMRGKAVLISGGTSGIGLAAARLLLRAGAKVALLGRESGRGKEALALLGQDFSPEHMRYIQGDVARRADCQRAVEETVAAFGRLDVLVNSAGLYREGALEEVTETINDGKEEIPYYRIEPVAVTKDNMDGEIIDSGFHRREDVYLNVE